MIMGQSDFEWTGTEHLVPNAITPLGDVSTSCPLFFNDPEPSAPFGWERRLLIVQRLAIS